MHPEYRGTTPMPVPASVKLDPNVFIFLHPAAIA